MSGVKSLGKHGTMVAMAQRNAELATKAAAAEKERQNAIAARATTIANLSTSLFSGVEQGKGISGLDIAKVMITKGIQDMTTLQVQATLDELPGVINHVPGLATVQSALKKELGRSSAVITSK